MFSPSMFNKYRQLQLWPGLSILLLAFVWLQPHHQPPWSGFHEDAGMAMWMAVGALLAVVLLLKRAMAWDLFALVCCGLAGVVALQSIAGLIASPGQALLFILHLFGLAWCYVVAKEWSATSRYLLLDIVFAGIALACLGNVAIALSQWLGLMPADALSTGGIWMMDIGDKSRFMGNVAQPNEFATLLAWGALAGVWAQIRKQVGMSVLALYLVFLAVGGALTQSRIGILEMTAIVAGLWLYRRHFDDRRVVLVAASALCVQLVLVASMPAILDFLLIDGEVRELAAMTKDPARLQIYSMVVEAIKLKPWLGYGAAHLAQPQWDVINVAPHLHAFYLQSHNWLLDLVLWFGMPVGIGIAICITWWLVGVVREVKQAHTVVPLLALVCFAMHATVELIHWVANFLLVAAVFAGFLAAHSKKKVLGTTTHGFNIFCLSALSICVVVTIVEYIKLEENFIKLRAEQLGLRKDITEVPQVGVLLHLADSLRVGRIPPTVGVGSATLAWMEQSERAIPNYRTSFDLILNLGLNGQHELARVWMERLNATSPLSYAVDYRRIWQRMQQIHPQQLQGLDWPASKP